MTVDEFANLINRVGTQLDQTTERTVAISSTLVNRIMSAAPSDTGRLRQSIQIRVENNREFYLEMLDYGFFQNYGVKASPDSTTAYNLSQTNVEDVVRFALPPSGGSQYQFGVRKADSRAWGAFYSGLNAKGFFSMAAISQEITRLMQEDLNNTIQ